MYKLWRVVSLEEIIRCCYRLLLGYSLFYVRLRLIFTYCRNKNTLRKIKVNCSGNVYLTRRISFGVRLQYLYQ